jgi:hypothetical protein
MFDKPTKLRLLLKKVICKKKDCEKCLFVFFHLYDLLRTDKPYRTSFKTHSVLALGKELLGIVGLSITISL